MRQLGQGQGEVPLGPAAAVPATGAVNPVLVAPTRSSTTATGSATSLAGWRELPALLQ